jgi:hypothetical protein
MDNEIKLSNDLMKRFYVTNEAAKILLQQIAICHKDFDSETEQGLHIAYHNLKGMVEKNSQLITFKK